MFFDDSREPVTPWRSCLEELAESNTGCLPNGALTIIENAKSKDHCSCPLMNIEMIIYLKGKIIKKI